MTVPKLTTLACLGIVTSGSALAGPVPATADDGGPRNWVVSASTAVNLREVPSSTARVLSRYAPGTVLDNVGGCTEANGRVWCDVQKLGGGARGYVALEFLKPAISPDGTAKTGPDDSALRAGEGKFDATGKVPCAQRAGQPMTQCDFGVARAGGGYATVVITRPDGTRRTIYFRMGVPIAADTSQADGYPPFSATKDEDLNLIKVGTERYEIPDAAVLGG